MKKSVIGSVLVLFALFFALTPAAGAASGDPQAEYTSMDGKKTTGTFEDMWNKVAEEGGTVKLLQDVTADSNGSFGTGAGFSSDGTICTTAFEFYTGKNITLDLNGKKLDRNLTSPNAGGHVIFVQGEFIIRDTSADQDGTITGGYTSTYGGGVYVASYGLNNSKNGRLYMYSGSITGNKAEVGAGVYLGSYTDFTLYGGKISENFSCEKNPLDISSVPVGGGIYLATDAELTFSNGEISHNIALGSGGGIYNTAGKVAMKGGTIKDNIAGCDDYPGSGGGIYTNKEFELTGGVIQNNTATDNGGGVYLGRADEKREHYTLSGSTVVKNNKVGDKANNVFIADKPKITVKGMSSAASVGISAPMGETQREFQISTPNADAKQHLSRFFADNQEQCYIEWDKDGSYIKLINDAAPHVHALNINCGGITEGGEPVTFAKRLTSSYGGYLYADGVELQREYHTVGTASQIWCYVLPAGDYYLGADINVTKPVIIGGAQSGSTVNLCLNGHVFKSGAINTSGAIIKIPDGNVLNLCDCRPETSHTDNTTLYEKMRQVTGGFITFGRIPDKPADTDLYWGGAIFNDGTLNLYGGTIAYNKALSGGGVYNNQTFHMYGGTISKNEAVDGGGLYNAGQCSIYGGRIESNTVSSLGGGIYHANGGITVSGSPVVSGNTRADNERPTNIYLTDQAQEVTIETLADGAKLGITTQTAPTAGSPVPISGEGAASSDAAYFESDNSDYYVDWEEDSGRVQLVYTYQSHVHALNDGCTAAIAANAGGEPVTFEHRLSTTSDGVLLVDGFPKNTLEPGNYYLEDDCTLGLRQSIVFSGEGTVNLCLNGHQIKPMPDVRDTLIKVNTTAFHLCDCKETGVITGGYATNEYGGGIRIEAEDFTIFSGTISGNYANRGGGIYAATEVFTIYGGTISGNEAWDGGGIYNTKGDLILQGGKISGNKARTGGGGIFNAGRFIMHAGEVSGNTAEEYGGGMDLSGGDDVISIIDGGVVTQNSTSGSGGGLSLVQIKLEMTGGTITGNQALAGGGISMGSFSRVYLRGGEIIHNEVTATDPSAAGAGIYDCGILYLSGSPVVYGNTKGGSQNNIFLRNQNEGRNVFYFEAGKSLTDGAMLGVGKDLIYPDTVEYPLSAYDENDVGASIDYLIPDNPNTYVVWNGTGKFKYFTLHVGKTEAQQHTHDGLTFTELSTLPSGTLTGGSYYLARDVELADAVTINGTVNLCLNGHRITGPEGDKPAFNVPDGAVLNLYNAEGTGSFAGLSGSGGILVKDGGTLNLAGEDGPYVPAGSGLHVTVDGNGTVTTTPVTGGGTGEGGEGGGGESGEDPGPGPEPGLPHAQRHAALENAAAISAANFDDVTKAEKPGDYTGDLPDDTAAYRYLHGSQYYLEGSFKMPSALVVTKTTQFCLNGSSLGANNGTWNNELGHVLWVPGQTVLTVLDCQRDLNTAWLYGGRVYLKPGAQVSIGGKVPDYFTEIKMAGTGEGEVKIERNADGHPVMILPDGATLTQKVGGVAVQTITKNTDGTLTVTTEGKTTAVTLPAGGSAGLTQPGGINAPTITLEVPAGSTVKAGSVVMKVDTINGGGTATVSPAGEVTLPAGSQVTVSNPEKEDAETVITLPGTGGDQEIKFSKTGVLTLPAGAVVTKPDGQHTTIGSSGGTFDPADGTITGEAPSGGNNPGSNPGGSSGTGSGSGSGSSSGTGSGSGSSSSGSGSGGSSGGGSGSSSGGGSSGSTVVKNEDGSTTTTQKNSQTGAVTETTKHSDGSTTVVNTQRDGTVTTTETDRQGNRTETVERPDGSSSITAKTQDGTTAQAEISTSGQVTASVNLSAEAAAQESAALLPLPALQAQQNAAQAPSVTIETQAEGPVRVEVPVSNVTPGTVAMLVHPDGSTEVLKQTVPGETGVIFTVEDGATVKIVDNGRLFDDVAETNWAAPAVKFVTGRELFAGVSETNFAPAQPMTRGMLMTVLARLDGQDTSGGSTWYESGVNWAKSNGISDGTQPMANISREQLVTMLWRYAGQPRAGGRSDFSDVAEAGDYATEALRWASRQGIILGYPDGTLRPRNNASRAEAAQMIMRYFSSVMK